MNRWINGDPSGFIEISADDVQYFDPYLERKLDGINELKAHYKTIEGKIHADEFKYNNLKVQVRGRICVLTFNLTSYTNAQSIGEWNCTEVYSYESDKFQIIQTHWSFIKPNICR